MEHAASGTKERGMRECTEERKRGRKEQTSNLVILCLYYLSNVLSQSVVYYLSSVMSQ